MLFGMIFTTLYGPRHFDSWLQDGIPSVAFLSLPDSTLMLFPPHVLLMPAIETMLRGLGSRILADELDVPSLCANLNADAN